MESRFFTAEAENGDFLAIFLYDQQKVERFQFFPKTKKLVAYKHNGTIVGIENLDKSEVAFFSRSKNILVAHFFEDDTSGEADDEYSVPIEQAEPSSP